MHLCAHPLPTGVIASFDPIDAVGTILSEGETLRFGRSACNFEPVAGIGVEITGTGSHPLGGRRATGVRVLPSQREALDEALEARDGPVWSPWTPSRGDVDDVQVTVLLKDRLAPTRGAVRRLLEGVGIEVDFVPALRIGPTGKTIAVFVSVAPFPQEGVDTRHVSGRSAAWGQSALTLGFSLHAKYGAPFRRSDVVLDALTRLLPVATGVIAHRAGHVLRDARFMANILAQASYAKVHPFSALLDLGLDPDPDHGGGHLSTWGLDLFDLPDVRARVDDDSDPAYERAQDAVWAAAMAMVTRGRPLAVGETITAPFGFDPTKTGFDAGAQGVAWRVVGVNRCVDLTCADLC